MDLVAQVHLCYETNLSCFSRESRKDTEAKFHEVHWNDSRIIWSDCIVINMKISGYNLFSITYAILLFTLGLYTFCTPVIPFHLLRLLFFYCYHFTIAFPWGYIETHFCSIKWKLYLFVLHIITCSNPLIFSISLALSAHLSPTLFASPSIISYHGKNLFI